MAGIYPGHVGVERLFAAQRVLAKFKRSHGRLLVQRLGWELLIVSWTTTEALAQKMLMRNSPATTMTAKVTPWIEKAACFDPPEPSTFDISPNAVKDSTRSAIPTVRGFLASIRGRTT